MNSQPFSQTTNSSSYLDSLLNIDQNEDNRSGLINKQKLSQSDNSDLAVDPLLGLGQDSGNLFDLMQGQLFNQASALSSQNDPLLLVDQDEAQANSFTELPQLIQSSNSDSLLVTGQDELSPSEPIKPPQSSASLIDSVLGVSREATLLSASSASAQAVSSPYSDVYYTFSYVYGNGDFYRGYGYVDASASAGYYAGQTIYRNDETHYNSGKSGYYYIDYVSNTGMDYGYQNQVTVTQYYDGETESNVSYLYTVNGAYGYGYGSGGLGTEVGYAYNYSFTNEQIYYGNGYYEADMTTV